MTTLGDYMQWLRSQGGECKSGIGPDPAIGMVPITKLIAPNGRWVIHYGGDQSEILSTYIIDHFDRRLQILSPFRSIPRS